MDSKKIISSAGAVIALGMIFTTMMFNPIAMFITSVVLLVVLSTVYYVSQKRN